MPTHAARERSGPALGPVPDRRRGVVFRGRATPPGRIRVPADLPPQSAVSRRRYGAVHPTLPPTPAVGTACSKWASNTNCGSCSASRWGFTPGTRTGYRRSCKIQFGNGPRGDLRGRYASTAAEMPSSWAWPCATATGRRGRAGSDPRVLANSGESAYLFLPVRYCRRLNRFCV